MELVKLFSTGIIDEEGKENWEVIEYLLEKGVPKDKTMEGKLTVSDIFTSKDWSYAETYEKIKKSGKSGIKKEEMLTKKRN